MASSATTSNLLDGRGGCFPDELSKDRGEEQKTADDHDRRHLVIMQDAAHQLVEAKGSRDLRQNRVFRQVTKPGPIRCRRGRATTAGWARRRRGSKQPA